MLWNVATSPKTLTVEAGAGGTGEINAATSLTLGPGGVVLVAIEANAGDEPNGAAFGDITAPIAFEFAASDETTAITAGTAKLTFRMPHAMYVTAVRASARTAPTGAVFTMDINEGGNSILSTKLTIDAGERPAPAATPAVISDPNLADDAEITIDFDTVGSGVARPASRASCTAGVYDALRLHHQPVPARAGPGAVAARVRGRRDEVRAILCQRMILPQARRSASLQVIC